MRTLSRLVLAGALAGSALLAPAAQASQPDCVWEPCYQCFMYPCTPGQWAEYLVDRVTSTHVCLDTPTACD